MKSTAFDQKPPITRIPPESATPTIERTAFKGRRSRLRRIMRVGCERRRAAPSRSSMVSLKLPGTAGCIACAGGSDAARITA